MKKKLFWKELTSDGLLKEPDGVGPYYNTERVNGFYGFDSEYDALAKLEQLHREYEYSISGNEYVLVTICSF